MNTTAAAAQAGVTIRTIRIWCRRGVVAAVKTAAGRWIIDAASLARRIAIGKERRMSKKTPVLSIENMVAIGCSRWQKAGMDRVYINDFHRYIGLETETYKSGNICWAALDGEEISNAEAYRIIGAVSKVYYDAADNSLHFQGVGSRTRSISREEICDRIRDGILRDIAAL